MKNATPFEIREEDRKIKLLRTIVDLTAAMLREGRLSREDAVSLVHNTRGTVLNLFPEKEEVYDLIYKPRFKRLLKVFDEQSNRI
ncbi:hypothetical protein KA005_57390 [bacterium]|nr:hypothetical protein [bacterium]